MVGRAIQKEKWKRVLSTIKLRTRTVCLRVIAELSPPGYTNNINETLVHNQLESACFQLLILALLVVELNKLSSSLSSLLPHKDPPPHRSLDLEPPHNSFPRRTGAVILNTQVRGRCRHVRREVEAIFS